MIQVVRAFAIATAFLPWSASAYEQATHALITNSAVAASLAGSASGRLLTLLGITGSLDEAGRYFDLESPANGAIGAKERRWQDYEQGMLGDLRLSRGATPAAWIIRGAIREDDNPHEVDPPTPQDVSPNLKRPLHHFFDPYFNRPLTALGVGALDPNIHKNPDWAIGTVDVFSTPNGMETGRRNTFSLADARESMFRALTLKWKDGSGRYPPLALGQVDAPTMEMWRKAYWASAFRALGDAVHLLQDMAQPQHTRNEMHAGAGCLPISTFCLAGDASAYEKYIDARTRQRITFASGAPFNTPVPISLAALPSSPYPVPSFQRYSDYWSTSPGPGSLTGRGMADYSSRGFFTAAANLGNTSYPRPVNALDAYVIETRDAAGWDGAALPGAPVHVYKGRVTDEFDPAQTATAVPLTSYGLWDQFMQAKGAEPKYTLNRINYDAMAELLIPRAVAYSAGLINYFFRGELEISPPQEGVYAIVDHAVEAQKDSSGFHQLKVNVRNVSRTDSGTEAMGSGQLFAVVRFHRNNCYRSDLSGQYGAPGIAAPACRSAIEEIVVSDPVSPPGGMDASARAIVFNFPGIVPINATDLQLQVVFRGALGQEADAIAVGARNISEPTFTSYLNSLDYSFDLVNGPNGPYPQVAPTHWNTPYAMTFGFSTLYPELVDTGPVSPGRFARVALLTDAPTYERLCACDVLADTFTDSAVDEADAAGVLRYVPYRSMRGVYLGSDSSNYFSHYNFVSSIWRELTDNDPHNSVLLLFPNIDPTPQPVAAIHFPSSGVSPQRADVSPKHAFAGVPLPGARRSASR